MTRILVCGGRNFTDRDAMALALKRFKPSPITEPSEHKIIAGGAPGADTLAIEWAETFGVPFRIFTADWKTHGRAAGPIRNQRMIDEGKPDLVIAMAGGRGTADMVRRAREAGIEVVEVEL